MHCLVEVNANENESDEQIEEMRSFKASKKYKSL